jgi:hypothetical protein
MRPRIGLALVVICAFVLAACNGATTEPADTDATPATEEATPTPDDAAGTDDEALERISEAAANTTGEGTARFEMTVETQGTGAGDGEQPVTVEGEEDFDAQQRLLTFVGPQGDLTMIVDQTTVYLEIPATEDDDWARIELDRMMSDDVGFGGPAGLPFQSPQDNLALLQNAVSSASEGGEEDVRGETATRYDLTVDLERAAEESAEDANQTFQGLVQQTGVSELDMQVWIDGDERVNRIAYTLDLSQADVDQMATELETEGVEADVEAEPTGEVTVTVEYFDFGTELTIEVPGDENVVDIDEDEIRQSFTHGGGTTGGTTGGDEATEEATPTEDAG